MNDTPPPRDSEYIADVPYDRTFVHQLTPSSLRLAAAMNGIAPPPEEDFDYLEIGSAHGDSLVALAAANPRGRFLGVDLNPGEVAFANELAREAGVDNVTFLHADFEELDASGLPAFDFISAHGFLTWVAAQKQEALLALARAKLKPGGLLYVSYNALPGWAPLEPLRRLMRDASAGVEGSTLDRARAGYAFVKRLADAGAGYVTSHPTVKSMLALIEKAGLAYVVHEYFNAHWRPMYFADVARAMSEHGLAFVGQLPLALNVKDLALPPAMKEIARHAVDRLAYETTKDFALNEMFRADLFAPAAVEPAEGAMRAYFERTRFGTTADYAHVQRTVKLPIYSLDFTGPVYDAILRAIAQSPASATELAERPAFAGIGVARIGDCLQNLALGGEVLPMRRAAAAPPAVGGYRVAHRRNQLVLDDVLAGGASPSVLSAPATGTCLPATLLEMVCLHLVTGVPATGRASWLRKFSHRPTPRLRVGGRVLDSGDEIVRVVTRELEGFMARSLPRWVELGIVEPVG